MLYKLFRYLAKSSLYLSFLFLTFSAKFNNLKAMYKIDELDNNEGFDVHFRFVSKEK